MAQKGIIQNCIICGNQLSDYLLIKQEHEDEKTISNTMCSSGCRSKYYRDLRDKQILKEAVEKQDYKIINMFNIKRILSLGYKIKIE